MAVGTEVDSLVGALPKGGEGDAAVQGTGAFFLDHGVEGVRCVAVLRDVERVGHGVVLGLEPDFDHFHWGYDCYGFGDACG